MKPERSSLMPSHSARHKQLGGASVLTSLASIKSLALSRYVSRELRYERVNPIRSVEPHAIC